MIALPLTIAATAGGGILWVLDRRSDTPLRLRHLSGYCWIAAAITAPLAMADLNVSLTVAAALATAMGSSSVARALEPTQPKKVNWALSLLRWTLLAFWMAMTVGIPVSQTAHPDALMTGDVTRVAMDGWWAGVVVLTAGLARTWQRHQAWVARTADQHRRDLYRASADTLTRAQQRRARRA